MATMAVQADLFESRVPAVDAEFSGIERAELPGAAWVEHQSAWLAGHLDVFESLADTSRWRTERRPMYERVVDVPRLLARLPEDGPGHPILADVVRALSRRHRLALESVSLAYYRDGRDSVAPHGDRIGRGAGETVVAIVSVGARRRFLLKPVAGGPSRVFRLGGGDLLVMGGACQRTWLHGVPKVRDAGPRISIQLRTGRT